MRVSVPEDESFSKTAGKAGISIATGDRELENLARNSEPSGRQIGFDAYDAHPAAQTQAASAVEGNPDQAAEYFAALERFRIETVESITAHVLGGGADGLAGRAVQELNRPVKADPPSLPPLCEYIHTVSAGARVHEARCTRSTSLKLAPLAPERAAQIDRSILRYSFDSQNGITNSWRRAGGSL